MLPWTVGNLVSMNWSCNLIDIEILSSPFQFFNTWTVVPLITSQIEQPMESHPFMIHVSKEENGSSSYICLKDHANTVFLKLVTRHIQSTPKHTIHRQAFKWFKLENQCHCSITILCFRKCKVCLTIVYSSRTILLVLNVSDS